MHRSGVCPVIHPSVCLSQDRKISTRGQTGAWAAITQRGFNAAITAYAPSDSEGGSTAGDVLIFCCFSRMM